MSRRIRSSCLVDDRGSMRELSEHEFTHINAMLRAMEVYGDGNSPIEDFVFGVLNHYALTPEAELGDLPFDHWKQVFQKEMADFEKNCRYIEDDAVRFVKRYRNIIDATIAKVDAERKPVASERIATSDDPSKSAAAGGIQ